MRINRQILQEKMKSPLYLLLINLLLAILIFFGAKLGSTLGIKDLLLPVSVVWPATGLSLAAILLFGFRVWPGIFFGNLTYNFFTLYTQSETLFISLTLAAMVAGASLSEALLAGYVMRRFSTPYYFKSVKDIYIFLIPAGVFATAIASSLAVGAMYALGKMPWPTDFHTWVTFFIGDSMGVYIVTPLLIVWLLQKAPVSIRTYPLEALFMTASFALLGLLSFIGPYPLAHLFIPLCVWVTYRFRMHGATLAIFLITLAAIVPASQGVGSFVNTLTFSPLALLVSFFEVIVVMCLILAAVVQERQDAWNALKKHNIFLQEAVDQQGEEIKQKQQQVFIKDKLSRLGISVSNLIQHMEDSVQQLHDGIHNSLEHVARAKELKPKNNEWEQSFQENLRCLENYMHGLRQCGIRIVRSLKVIKEQLHVISSEWNKVSLVNLNVMLQSSLNQVMNDHRHLEVIVVHDLDKSLGMMEALPLDFVYVFNAFFRRAFQSMHAKKERLGFSYKPIFEISTIKEGKGINITIRDNGEGIAESRQPNFHKLYIDGDGPDEQTELQLFLAQDILITLYEAHLIVESKESEFFQIQIILRK